MRRSAARGAMLLTAASFCWPVRGRMRKVLVVSKESSRDKDKCKVEKLLKTVQNKKWNNNVGRKLKWTPGRYSADGDKWRKRKWREELQTDGETDTWMNIQKEEEGCERDKSDRVRREKRGRGKQKIQTSQRLMSEGASTDGQQGKWDTFTWLSCSMWTSSMFISLCLLLLLDPRLLSPLLLSRVGSWPLQTLPDVLWEQSCHLGQRLINRLAPHSGGLFSSEYHNQEKSVPFKSPPS